MLRPGDVDLPLPPETTVLLASIAHSMQLDTLRKFAATYEDIAQHMDKCEYLFDHDVQYDTSYKSLAKAVAELNKIGTDAQQQEREQLYNGLTDWLSSSSFTLQPPTHGIINEDQLDQSAQTTRDVLLTMLLGLERLQALHIAIMDKVRSGGKLALEQTETSDSKRQELLKVVGESTFVWKTAAAEIVELLRDEHSKDDEVVELYADKIRYLIGELEAQSNMIEELRMQLERQARPLPLKLQDVDAKAMTAKHEVKSRHSKQTAAGQQPTTSDDDNITTTSAVATLPDFDQQLVATLQKELEECRRQNASVVARGHEAAAKLRFLAEESNRKDKQIAQLQANIAKLKNVTRDTEPDGRVTDASKGQHSEEQHSMQSAQIGSKSVGRSARRRPAAPESVQLQDKKEDDESETQMQRTQMTAAARRQRQPDGVTSATAQSANQLTTAESRGDARTGRSAEPTKPGKPTRALRGREKTGAAALVAAATAAAPDKQAQSADDVSQAPSSQRMSSFGQQTVTKEWTPVGASVDNADTAKALQMVARSIPQQMPVGEVDMNEAIEMTKLFVAGSKNQQMHQQQTTMKGDGQQQQRRPVSAVTNVAAFSAPTSPRLLTESSGTKPFRTPTSRRQPLQRRDKAPSQRVMASFRHPGETLATVGLSSRQRRAKAQAEAAKLRVSRLSDVPFHSDERRSKAAVQSARSAALRIQLTEQQQQQQQIQQQTVTRTKSKRTTKAGYDLVDVNMQNLAQRAKQISTQDSAFLLAASL